MKDNKKENPPNAPTKEDLLLMGVFYKWDSNGDPIYQYDDRFYGIVGDKICKLRMKSK